MHKSNLTSARATIELRFSVI